MYMSCTLKSFAGGIFGCDLLDAAAVVHCPWCDVGYNST